MLDTDSLPPSHTPAIGTPLYGGFFAGTFLLDGRIYGLIVAPKANGETEAEWRTTGKDKTAPCSLRDGRTNTDGINDAQHPAAAFCRSLTIGGFTDWYLPSRHEAALLAENLMPGEGYVPAQTTAEAFQEGGPEAFTQDWYWTSTEFSSGSAWVQTFYGGSQSHDYKDWSARVRAVRKFPL